MDWHRITERCECVSVDESLICMYHLSGGGVVLIDAGAAESPELLEDIRERGWRCGPYSAPICTLTISPARG